MILKLAAAATLTLAPATTVPPMHAAPLAPGCQHATIQMNSGNGPDYRVVICYALKPHGAGKRWVLINDGSSKISNGTVFIGARVPVKG
jgi:hypothetical protein